ncbi:hypothetical protein Leryth_012646, partial [Lithospermum erythrorhizon]
NNYFQPHCPLNYAFRHLHHNCFRNTTEHRRLIRPSQGRVGGGGDGHGLVLGLGDYYDDEHM